MFDRQFDLRLMNHKHFMVPQNGLFVDLMNIYD